MNGLGECHIVADNPFIRIYRSYDMAAQRRPAETPAHPLHAFIFIILPPSPPPLQSCSSMKFKTNRSQTQIRARKITRLPSFIRGSPERSSSLLPSFVFVSAGAGAGVGVEMGMGASTRTRGRRVV